jgi:hypothetical protein
MANWLISQNFLTQLAVTHFKLNFFFESFFFISYLNLDLRRTIQVLLEQELQMFMKRTLVNWVDLLYANPPPQFAMQLTLDDGLEFYPSYETLEEVRLLID